MRRAIWTGILALAAVAGASSPVALAGGLELYEIGSPDTGLAAAGYAARAQDASTVFTNPAGMARLDGPQMLAGLQPLFLDIDFHADGKTTNSGGNGGNAGGWIPSGSTFFVCDVSPDVRLGAGLFSYFGLGIDYANHWAGRYYVQNATLMGLTFMPAASYRISEQFSVGAGLNAMYGLFEQDVAVNNVADRLGDGRIRIEDDDWGFGGNFGVLFEPSPTTRFGLTYLSAVDLTFEDSPEFKGFGPALSGLLERKEFRSLGLDMTVPQSVMASAYHELDDCVAVLGNVGWQDWGDFGRVGVEISSAEPDAATVDRNYQDTWHVAAGMQYRPAPEWTLSCGVAYDTSMVENDDRTADTPVGASWRLGLGVQYQVTETVTLGVAYEAVWCGDVPLDQNRGPLAGRLSGEYRNMIFHVVAFSIAVKL